MTVDTDRLIAELRMIQGRGRKAKRQQHQEYVPPPGVLYMEDTMALMHENIERTKAQAQAADFERWQEEERIRSIKSERRMARAASRMLWGAPDRPHPRQRFGKTQRKRGQR